MTNTTNTQTPLFSWWQLFSYGFLTAPIAMGGFALVMYIPTFYAVDMGIGLGLVGAVFVAGRLFDVITDPLIGHLSDETQSRLGPRKPWMLLGVPCFSISIWLLLVPPPDAGLMYLLVTSGLYFLFYTVLDVPYSSTGLEVSPRLHERSVLASSKAGFQVIGALIVAALPILLASSIGNTLPVIAKTVMITSVLGLILFMQFMPRSNRVVTEPRVGLTTSIKLIWQKQPYKLLIVSFFIVQAANALTAGLMVLFITHMIGTPEMIGLFMGLLLLSSAIFLPIWVLISKWKTKRFAWQTAVLCGCGTLAIVPLLGSGNLWGMALVSSLLGACFGSDAIMPTSMLADIVHEGEKDGKRRLGGLALAVKNAVSKLAFVAPMGLAFPLLDLIGFQETGPNSSFQQAALVFFFAGLPILLRLCALYGIMRLSIPNAEPS